MSASTWSSVEVGTQTNRLTLADFPFLIRDDTVNPIEELSGAFESSVLQATRKKGRVRLDGTKRCDTAGSRDQ
jgi:hypothetical protein